MRPDKDELWTESRFKVVRTEPCPVTLKVSYATRKSASRMKKRMRRLKNYHCELGKVLRTYRCPFCNFWHLGHGAVR